MCVVCMCVQWLFLKLCGTHWTGSNQELTRDTDKFIKSKGNLLFYIKTLHSRNCNGDYVMNDL